MVCFFKIAFYKRPFFLVKERLPFGFQNIFDSNQTNCTIGFECKYINFISHTRKNYVKLRDNPPILSPQKMTKNPIQMHKKLFKSIDPDKLTVKIAVISSLPILYPQPTRGRLSVKNNEQQIFYDTSSLSLSIALRMLLVFSTTSDNRSGVSFSFDSEA